MARFNTYILGGTPEINITAYDRDGVAFEPTETRLSIKQPDGVTITYSGADLTLGSGYQWTLYRPPIRGWYEYESWVKDGTGREATETNGFEVIDRVY